MSEILRNDWPELLAAKTETADLYKDGIRDKKPMWMMILERGVGINPKTGKIEALDYVEKTVDKGGGRWAHSGHVETTDPDNPRARLAGTKQIEEALVLKTEEMIEEGFPVQEILLGAGKAKYIQEMINDGVIKDPDFACGKVVEADLRRRKPELFAEDGLPIVTFPEDTNTLQDLEQGISRVSKSGGGVLVIITIRVHVKRTNLLALFTLHKSGIHNVGLKILGAEEILQQNNSSMMKEIQLLQKSFAAKQTARDEAQGVNDFLAGKYASTQNLPETTVAGATEFKG